VGHMMQVQQSIRKKLEQKFTPLRLEIVDDSHQHAGHSGTHPDGESHFRVELVSAAFHGKGRAERYRLVHYTLAAELADRVHALSLRLLSPEEDAG